MEGTSEEQVHDDGEEAAAAGAPAQKHFAGEPWERQPDETSVAWEAFVLYRDMGAKRSNAKVARTLGKSKQLIDRWSSRHKWVRRIEAFEQDQEREYQAELADARRAMARRQAANAAMFQDAALKALRAKFGEDLSKINARSMKNGEVLKFFIDAAKIERAALGQPIEGDGESESPLIVNENDRKPAIPITFSGRIEGAMELLETARARAANGPAVEPD